MKNRSKSDVKLIKIYVKLIGNPLKLVQNRSLEGSGGHVGPQDPRRRPDTLVGAPGIIFWAPKISFLGRPRGLCLAFLSDCGFLDNFLATQFHDAFLMTFQDSQNGEKCTILSQNTTFQGRRELTLGSILGPSLGPKAGHP